MEEIYGMLIGLYALILLPISHVCDADILAMDISYSHY